VRKADNLQPSCAVVTKSGNLNFLEPSGPVQACNGPALPYLKLLADGRVADHSPLLVPWSRKGRAIPLLPLWAVRPVQGLFACTGVHFTLLFYLILLLETNIMNYSWIISRVKMNVIDPDDRVLVQNASVFASEYSRDNHAVYDSF